MKIYLYPFVGLLLACAHDGQLPVEPERVALESAKMSECLTGYCDSFKGVWKAMGGEDYLIIGAESGTRLVLAYQSFDEIEFEFFDQFLLANDLDICFMSFGEYVLFSNIQILTQNRIKFWIFTYERVTSESEEKRARRLIFGEPNDFGHSGI